MITVYTKPACAQCEATRKYLERHEIAYDTVDLAADDQARDYVVNTLGYISAPVVVAGDEHWVGFKPDRIRALVT